MRFPNGTGILGSQSFMRPISAAVLQRKIDLLMLHFGSQRSKHWFDEETFRGLARLRGMECALQSTTLRLSLDASFPLFEEFKQKLASDI